VGRWVEAAQVKATLHLAQQMAPRCLPRTDLRRADSV
jgi:hypothetical protein